MDTHTHTHLLAYFTAKAIHKEGKPIQSLKELLWRKGAAAVELKF